jgi:hypothetical protein
MPPAALSAWIAELASVWPDLSRPQIKMLAQYSMGMILAESSGLSRVAFCLSQWLGQPFANVRERLRDFYCARRDKTGRRRRELEVEACFPGLLGWVLRRWQGDELPIAIDATTLGRRFVVLAISVVYAGTAMAVAWKILPVDARGSWKAHGLRLLRKFKGIVPSRMKVIVLADRGLYAKWLFEGIVKLGWHPFLRINAQGGEFRAESAADYQPLNQLLKQPGETYGRSGTLFRSASAQLPCTLTACWAQQCAEPWIIATDLPADQAQATWYGLRGWIERGFKHDKTGAMRWQNTRMTDPDRASVLGLVMAIARLLSMLGGTQHFAAATESQSASKRHPLMTGKNPRPIPSVFVVGLLLCRVMLLTGLVPLDANLTPAAWPDATPTHLSQALPMPP